MAELRPYRAPGAAAARLQQVKKYAAVLLGLSFLIVNWMTTQHAAWLMGDSPRLGRALFTLPWVGPVYAPWKWVVWAWNWHAIERMMCRVNYFCRRVASARNVTRTSPRRQSTLPHFLGPTLPVPFSAP